MEGPIDIVPFVKIMEKINALLAFGEEKVVYDDGDTRIFAIRKSNHVYLDIERLSDR